MHPWPSEVIPLLLIALSVSALGFYRLVYFVSIGYAGSVALQSAWLAVSSTRTLSLASWAHAALLALYGIRLGSYLVQRQFEPAYRRELVEVEQRAVGVGPGKKVAIWLSVSVLYVCMISPFAFEADRLRLAGPAPSLRILLSGLALMASGLLLESTADWQKARFKRLQPSRFCDIGLYRWVRCPNYFGEVLFWIGNFIAGFSALSQWPHWVIAGTGLVCIVLIMMGSTKRLEAKQAQRYGSDPEYQRYATTVPVLFPWVPVYSLKNVRVVLE